MYFPDRHKEPVKRQHMQGPCTRQHMQGPWMLTGWGGVLLSGLKFCFGAWDLETCLLLELKC